MEHVGPLHLQESVISWNFFVNIDLEVGNFSGIMWTWLSSHLLSWAWLLYIGDEILPSYITVGIISSHYEDPAMNPSV